MANLSICNACKTPVPVTHACHDNKEHLIKHCPQCGDTTTLVSNDSARYRSKAAVLADREFSGCRMDCASCHHRHPNLVFVETTNRCNMRCPICITNVPSMGFQYEPRLEFFDRIFKHYASMPRKPKVMLFGGEPTMRDDIFEIIELGQSYGLVMCLVTNGLKLADEEFARKVIQSGADIHIAFDGLKDEMYEKLRNYPRALDLKLKALDNITHKAEERRRIFLMTVVDKQMNGDDIPDFLQYCLTTPNIRGVYFIPLTHVWTEERLDYKPDRTCPEDVENFVSTAVSGGAEFIPLGSWDFKHLLKLTGIKLVPFTGVHPNCESFSLLVPQKDKFVCISHYLKRGLLPAIQDARALDKKIAARGGADALSLSRKLWVYLSLVGLVLRHLDLGAVVDARGIRAVGRWLRLLGRLTLGQKAKNVFKEETSLTSLNRMLQVLILPFEDDETVESARLKECSSCFAYVDVATDSVESIPFCIWEKYKKVVMRDIAEVYNKEGYDQGISRRLPLVALEAETAAAPDRKAA